MSRFVQENLVSLVLLVIFVAYIVISFQYGPRARLVPVPVAVLSGLLVVAQMIVHNTGGEERLRVDVLDVVTRGKGQARAAEELEEAESAAEEVGYEAPSGTEADSVAPEEAGGESGRSEWLAGMLVVVLLGLVLLLGPMAGIFVFTFGYFAVFSGYRWFYALLFSGALVGALYVLFVVLLETQLYYGILSPIFLP